MFVFLFSILFLSKMLHLKQNFPKLHKISFALLALNLLSIILILSIPKEYISSLVMTVTLLMFPLLMSISIAGWYKGEQAAKYLTIGWGLFVALSAIYSLRVSGVVPGSFLADYAVEIGSALEALLFSFALLARFNQFKNEKLLLEQRAQFAIDELGNLTATNSMNDVRKTTVDTMRMALVCWQESTGKDMVDLAKESKQWGSHFDKSTATWRSQALARYRNLKTLPSKPRINKVIETVEFVLKHCPPETNAHRELHKQLSLLNEQLQKRSS